MSNLPPGCSTSDLPGSSESDSEILWGYLEDKLKELGIEISEEKFELLAIWFEDWCNLYKKEGVSSQIDTISQYRLDNIRLQSELDQYKGRWEAILKIMGSK